MFDTKAKLPLKFNVPSERKMQKNGYDICRVPFHEDPGITFWERN